MFELFCLVNNFMIWKRKKKERKKKGTFNGGGSTRTRKLWIMELAPYHWATETNYNYIRYKICIYIQYGFSDIRPSTCAIPQFRFWLKNLIKCIYKVVNVSKSHYEFDTIGPIMNLQNQNSKYSWRIRDLENPQTGTQFANSVLMYKMSSCHDDRSRAGGAGQDCINLNFRQNFP